MVAIGKYSSLLQTFVNYGRRKFYDIGASYLIMKKYLIQY